MNKPNHPFIYFCRLNQYVTDKYWEHNFTLNDMIMTVGVFKLDIPDEDFFMVFSCPSDDSKNIFFALSEGEFDTAALCVAYCEYYTYGKLANIEEYIWFNQVFIPELSHIHGILLSTTQQMKVLKEYPEVLHYEGKDYKTLFCIACSDKDHETLSRLGFMDGMLSFYDNGKNFADFRQP